MTDDKDLLERCETSLKANNWTRLKYATITTCDLQALVARCRKAEERHGADVLEIHRLGIVTGELTAERDRLKAMDNERLDVIASLTMNGNKQGKEVASLKAELAESRKRVEELEAQIPTRVDPIREYTGEPKPIMVGLPPWCEKCQQFHTLGPCPEHAVHLTGGPVTRTVKPLRDELADFQEGAENS